MVTLKVLWLNGKGISTTYHFLVLLILNFRIETFLETKMENTDLIEQTIEHLKSDGLDNLNKWITSCTKEEAFLQLVYEPKEVNSENNEFNYR